MDKFSVEEINLMCIYDTSSKTAVLSEIRESMGDVYDPDLLELMCELVDKLENISDEEFAQIDFFPISDYYEMEEDV